MTRRSPLTTVALVCASQFTLDSAGAYDADSGVNVSFHQRAMTVTGSHRADRITIVRRGDVVTVKAAGEVVTTRSATRIRGFRIKGRQGDDRISMVDHKHRRQRGFLFGGPGDDRLVGATGGDFLEGGEGEDILVQSRGTNFLRGGPGDDTYRLDGDVGANVWIEEYLPGGTDTVDLSRSSGDVRLFLSSSLSAGGTSPLGLRLVSPAAMENGIGGLGDDVIAGNSNDNVITGGAGAEVFSFFGTAGQPIGDDSITDFDRVLDGDSVDLPNHNFVHSGLGTGTVTIWDGETDFGTITATNGHLWAAEDFT